jgi:hypothetical protein
MFDEGTTKGLLLNNLFVNECMMISLDSYTLSAGVSELKPEMNKNNDYYTKPMRINNNFLEAVRNEAVMCQDLRDFMNELVGKDDID